MQSTYRDLWLTFSNLNLACHCNVHLGIYFISTDRFSLANKPDEKALQEWQARLLLQ